MPKLRFLLRADFFSYYNPPKKNYSVRILKMSGPTVDPAGLLNQAISGIIGRFVFETPSFVVGRADPDGLADPGLYDGLIVSSHGYARVARHIPTGTICLFASKESYNLKGERQQDGTIVPAHDSLNRSYIAAAYRSSGLDSDTYKAAPLMRRALKRFWENLGERSEKHFTKYGALLDGVAGFALSGDMIEVHTNGRLDYLLSKHGKRYKLRFIAPTRRKHGSFIPPALTRFSLRDIFSGVSKRVALNYTYQMARHSLAAHWQIVSSKLWDEKNLFEGEGIVFKAKKFAASVANTIAEDAWQLSLATTLTGATIGTFVNPAYGLAGGVAAAAVHTGIHMAFDESFRFSNEMWKRAREARSRLNLDAYPATGDVSDHFKIQTAENIKKVCSKPDLWRFPAHEFEFLTSARSGLLLDHEHAMDGFHPTSLQAYLLTAHQRGFSSSCMFPDRTTMVNIFQSGLVRLMHEKPDGRIVVYGRYRADACIDTRVQMPEEKREKFSDRIVRFEYDRRAPGFYQAFHPSPEPVTMEHLMAEMEDSLFATQQPPAADVRARSLQSIRESFERAASGEPGCVPSMFMSAHPPALPSMRAIV